MDSANQSTIRKPFLEHVHEFRRRLLWCALFFAIGGGIGFALYEPLLEIVQKPLDQTLYYTSPTGGFNFVFKVCAAFGLVIALPMIVYQMLKFIEPVTRKNHRRAVLTYLIWSANLAYIGVLFGYLVSLPAALHFLTRFGGESIQALITADEYFSFALAYIVGFSLLFQLPLIILFINRIKPLKPGGMMGAQRWVILISFIVAAILTPTPDPMNQMIMAVPVIVLYQVSILLVWLVNRKKFANPIVDNNNQAPTESSSPVRAPRLLNVAIEEVSQHFNKEREVPAALAASRQRSINGIVNNKSLVGRGVVKPPIQQQDVNVAGVNSDEQSVQVKKLIDIMA